MSRPPDCRQSIVTNSTGCANPELAEEIYQYYSRPEAWNVAAGAPHALMRLRDAGELQDLTVVAQTCRESQSSSFLQ